MATFYGRSDHKSATARTHSPSAHESQRVEGQLGQPAVVLVVMMSVVAVVAVGTVTTTFANRGERRGEGKVDDRPLATDGAAADGGKVGKLDSTTGTWKSCNHIGPPPL